MDETWYSKIEGKVFTQVSYMLTGCADAPFPTLHCTSVNEAINPAKLPCMYLHELNPIEIGQDLDNVTVNAIEHTVEIQVWSNKGQSECKSILTAAINEMKKLRYNIVMFPTVKTDSGISWGVTRARRVIGAGDKL